MNARFLLGGVKSFLPIRLGSYKGTGGSITGRYCYSVWLRHLAILHRHLPEFHPGVVVELGPGDSIGLGLAALLSGSERYIGLDVVEHASSEVNLSVLDELVTLFRARTRIPDATAFPQLLPHLDDYAFPLEALNMARLEQQLRDEFVYRLRAVLKYHGSAEELLQYKCPWKASSVASASVDLVITQVALQDMDHGEADSVLRENLRTMASWLKPGGVMSHQVDFSCPGGDTWNHHWAFSDLAWKIVRGRRPYYVNRVSLSLYESLLDEVGMDLVAVKPVTEEGLARIESIDRFRSLPDSDFHSRAALFVAQKR
jgi:hypothetical protein